MKKQWIQGTTVILGILLLLASIPTMSAQSDENYQVIAEKASFEKDSFYLAE